MRRASTRRVATGWPLGFRDELSRSALRRHASARVPRAAVEDAARGIAEDHRPCRAETGCRRMKRLLLYRLAVVAGAIALLEIFCLTGVIDKITMQPPHLIARDLYRLLASGRMNGAIWKTSTNTLLALVLALGAGVIAAALRQRLRALRAALDLLVASYD